MALFNHAVAWLRGNRVLLPGVSVLAREVSEIRAVAEKRLHTAVAKAAMRADPALPAELATLLEVPEGARLSHLETLLGPPTRTPGTALARALDRVNEISAFQLGRVNLTNVPVNRLSTLARYGLASKAASIERAPDPRKTALMTAVVRSLEAAAIDDALDLFAPLMATKVISPARRASDKERLAMLPQLEKASRTLARASKVLIEEMERVQSAEADLDVAALWAAVEEVATRAQLSTAVTLIHALVPEDDGSAEAALRDHLALRYNTVRPFLTLLGESDALGAATGGRRVLAGVRKLPALSRRKVKDRPLLPKEIDAELVPPMWKRAVYSNAKLAEGAVDREAYVVCVLEQLFRALGGRDVFASPSHRRHRHRDARRRGQRAGTAARRRPRLRRRPGRAARRLRDHARASGRDSRGTGLRGPARRPALRTHRSTEPCAARVGGGRGLGRLRGRRRAGPVLHQRALAVRPRDRRRRDRHLGLRGPPQRGPRGVPATAPGRHPPHGAARRRDVGPRHARCGLRRPPRAHLPARGSTAAVHRRGRLAGQPDRDPVRESNASRSGSGGSPNQSGGSSGESASAVRSVLDIGGGLAGCAAAILLADAGVAVDLVEVKPDASALGSGITLQGNALRVLSQLGVWDQVEAHGFGFSTTGMRAPDGTVLRLMPDARTGGPDLPAILGMDRRVLAAILMRRVQEAGAKVRLGVTPSLLQQDEHGVDIGFADGSSARYDLVIGADGVRSWTRRALGIELPTRPTGMGIWRIFGPRPKSVVHTDLYYGGACYIAGYCPTGEDSQYAYLVEDAQDRSGLTPSSAWRRWSDSPRTTTARGTRSARASPTRPRSTTPGSRRTCWRPPGTAGGWC